MSKYKGILHREVKDFREFSLNGMEPPLSDLFFRRSMKKLRKPDGFNLYCKSGVDFFSTSHFLYPKMKTSVRLVEARLKFNKISDYSNVSPGLVGCPLSTRRTALTDDYHKRRWTCLRML